MKKLLAAMFVALLMVGCGGAQEEAIDLDDNETLDKIIAEAIGEDDLQTRYNHGETLPYDPNEQKPYTGWAKWMYDNGQINGLWHYKDGKRDGLTIEWRENGQKRVEGSWKDGKRHGLTVWYNEDGTENNRVTYPEEPVAETKPPEAVSVSLNLKYEIKGDAVTITGCDKKASGALTIPAALEGKLVTSIGGKAFQGCTGLRSITMPDGVTSIGKSAFSRCSRLTSITIPDGITSIGNWAFSSCTSLTSIMIPDSVTSIGVTTFLWSSSLMTIEVGAGNVNYTDVNGTLFNSEKTVLLTYPAGKKGANYNIPNSVTSIGDYAFYDCRGLTSITIGDGVTTIGKEAFHGCSRLMSITIPDSVTSIGDYAFVHCTSLTSITIPAAVAVIRNGVFDNCTSLTRLIFLGDAPEDKTGLINTFPTIYRKPEAKGWDDKWSRRPVKLIDEKP